MRTSAGCGARKAAAVCTGLVGNSQPAYRQQVLETVLMMLLLEDRVEQVAFERRISVVLDEYGWRGDGDRPLAGEEARLLCLEALWDLRVLGALGSEDMARPVGLNAVGREAALASIRARVMQGWWWG